MIPVSVVAVLALSCSAFVGILTWFLGPAQGRERACEDAHDADRAVANRVRAAEALARAEGHARGHRAGRADLVDRVRAFLTEIEDEDA